MLLARSVGSIGIAGLPFGTGLGPVGRPSSAPPDADRADRPSQGRAGRGLGPGGYHPPGGARWNRNNAHNCTPATPCLKPVRQLADCGHSQWLPGPCSLGLQPLRRTRCSGQVGPVPARLHDSPRLLHASTRSGNWPDQPASAAPGHLDVRTRPTNQPRAWSTGEVNRWKRWR
jgi:hypothetical protein